MTEIVDLPVLRKVYSSTVFIKATPEAIWDAITKSEWTERYGLTSAVEFDLKPGGAFRVLTPERMKADGLRQGRELPDSVVEGEVLAAFPGRRLVTTYQLTLDKELSDEPPGRLSYLIEPGGHDVTALTVVFEASNRLARVASGAAHADGAIGGFDWVVSDLKSVLETGSAFKE